MNKAGKKGAKGGKPTADLRKDQRVFCFAHVHMCNMQHLSAGEGGSSVPAGVRFPGLGLRCQRVVGGGEGMVGMWR